MPEGKAFNIDLGRLKSREKDRSPQAIEKAERAGEELGFIGAILLIVLFTLLLLRGLHIALRAKDKFGAMLCVGVSVQIALQTFLHIAVNTNAIPSTGISLPFFSSGGTSLVMLMGQVGVMLSVSRQSYTSLAQARQKAQEEAEGGEAKAVGQQPLAEESQ